MYHTGFPCRTIQMYMKTHQEVLLVLQSRMDDYKSRLQKYSQLAFDNYMKFFELHACDAFKLAYKIESLSVFFKEDGSELEESELREYLQAGIGFFTKELLERPLQAATSNAMTNQAHVLKLEAAQELLRLYKQMMSKFDIK